MIRFKKCIAALAALSVLTALPVMNAYADEPTAESPVTETSVVTTVPYETGAASEEPEATGDASVTSVSPDTYAEEEINKYFSDSNYDTDGNATLIKKEKVIYDSEEMQFIAVTTKDGSVFYVLINYSAAGDEDNVFFLNKVDDYDLYALLYSGSEDDVIDRDAAAEAADKATGNNLSENYEDVPVPETHEPETKTEVTSSSFGASTIIIVVLVIAAAAVGGFLFFKSGKKKNETIDFDDTELDIEEE